MKAISLDAALADFTGQGHQRGGGRVPTMKAGVENCYLRHVWQASKIAAMAQCCAVDGVGSGVSSVNSARISRVTTVGPAKCGPPCTTRWPTPTIGAYRTATAAICPGRRLRRGRQDGLVQLFVDQFFPPCASFAIRRGDVPMPSI